jgi:FkbM family methyltransferase
MNFNDIPSKYKIVIWGASSSGEATFLWLQNTRFSKNIVSFCDNNHNKFGQTFFGLPIISPKEVSQMDPSSTVIVIGSMYFDDIYKQLVEMGMHNVFVGHCMFYNMFLPEYTIERKKYPLKDIVKQLYMKENKNSIHMLNVISQIRSSLELAYPYDFVRGLQAHEYWDDLHITQENNITVIDCGAFIGDSIPNFLRVFGDKLHLYIPFEPNENNYTTLLGNINKNKINPISRPIMKGVWDKTETIKFNDKNLAEKGAARISDEGETTIQVTCLDDINQDFLGKIYIKMDIEGAEISALKGAEALIKKHKPNFAICVYHRPADIWEIPQYLRSIVPDYKFHIGGGCHTVCYAEI